MNCATCGKELSYRWTDTHGIGVCLNCATPYKLLHYAADGHPLDLPPSPALDATGMAIAKRYWDETGKKTFPGVYDFTGVHHRRGDATYSGATAGEIQAFDAWYDAHYPAPATDNTGEASYGGTFSCGDNCPGKGATTNAAIPPEDAAP